MAESNLDHPRLLQYVIEGENEGGQMAVDGQKPPFAIFCVELQNNVGGPYAERNHADAALALIKTGQIQGYAANFRDGTRLAHDCEIRKGMNG